MHFFSRTDKLLKTVLGHVFKACLFFIHFKIPETLIE